MTLVQNIDLGAMPPLRLYHGSGGGGYSPNPIHLERLISLRFKKHGVAAKRHGKSTLYASTSKRQAEDYCDRPENLLEVQPHRGTRLTWMTGVADMILDFETYLKNRWMRSAYYFQGKDHRALLHDTQGSVATIDTYLAMGRQRPAVSRMIDSFINLQSLNEIIYETPKDLEKLGKHRGEVILTGAWDLHQQGKNIQ